MGELFALKRTSSIAVCILLLCSLLLIVNVGTTMATAAGYSFTEYYGGTAVTIDGKWTTADEWQDVTTQRLGTPQVAVFEYKMDTTAGYMMTWLLEFADKTNDAGDRWQICIDGSLDEGSAPNSNDIKIEIEGHTTLKFYIGNGTGWATTTATGTFKDSITTSPHDPANHYVLELAFDKSQWEWGVNPPPHGLRVAMYDASNPAQGWVAWPPTSTDTNPSGWGSIPDYTAAPAPEGLTIGVMMLVSCVAVIVSSRYFRKRPKTTKL
jgi:hypothetical protein